MGKVLRLLLAIGFILTTTQIASALNSQEVPEPLRPWIDWVLKDHQEKLCPFLQGGSGEQHCAWASPLELTINIQDGRFAQNWQVDAKTWIQLPGDTDHWPQEVQINGQAAQVIDQDGKPSLFLSPGKYQLSGTFAWDKLPESFPIPPETGILQLTVQGKPKPFPQVDENGLIWIKREGSVDEGENRLELRVYRKLIDEIPFQLTTVLHFNVSGQAREVVFDQVMPEGFIPMTLNSPIPARVEKGNQLRVQVKPGEWNVEITGRKQQTVNTLTATEHPAPWPTEEIWVFQAENNLRLVWVEGVPAIDPQQTTLPDAWKSLPAYRLQPGQTIKLVEKRRGDSEPAPDQLSLYREWWLDFNGDGFTLQDEITGTLHRSWRLDMNLPIHLGRISVDGRDQFITKLPGQDKLGIEVRQGSVQVSADSRIDGDLRKVPAVGWDHNFQKVSGVLNLPPGWRLFSVSGADHVPHTWINDWTLLDIFLVLITALAFWKLFGIKWGAVALATFVLTFPEKGSPQWVWLALILGFAILRLLPKGKMQFLMRAYKFITLIVLVIIAIPFMIQQLRVGIYPAMEYPYATMQAQTLAKTKRPKARPIPAPRGKMEGRDALVEEEAKIDDLGMEKNIIQSAPSSGYLRKSQISNYKQQVMLQEQRPGAKVQTGPGLPHWEWNEFPLQWNGPVERGQELRFCLVPPYLNLILAFVRVALLALLILCVLGVPGETWKRFFRPRMAALLLPFLLGMGVMLNSQPVRADFPSQEMLDQLRERLLEDPACHPDCGTIPRMMLEVTPNYLRARLEINAESNVAVPLPGGVKEWMPRDVTVNGNPIAGLMRSSSGQLWIALPAGVHQVTLSGPLPDRQTVQVPLPLRPHRLESKLSGWTLEGIHENGVPDNTLQLNRLARNGVAPTGRDNVTGSTGLVPFVRVRRELVLGLNWEVLTFVQRATPLGVPVVLEVPLLEGESVTTQGIRVEDGKALVNMAPNVDEVQWRSVLQESDTIQLKAPEVLNYMEVWELNVSPVWHVSFSGIPVIHSSRPQGKWLPEWRPWPGEEVTIQVIRPEGVPGQTLTVDQSLAEVTPGLRFTEVLLSLTLRSSLGGQQVLSLPKGTELQSVEINGQTQPIRLEAGKLTLPIVPGEQRVKIRWQQAGGITTFFSMPPVDLGIPSVNSEIIFKMPRNRWVLFTWGPTMGPAVMFWSLLVVLLLFSFGLSRLGWTPLKTWHWFLLGVGISQFPEFPVVASVFVAGWLLTLGWREKKPELGKFWFDLRQIVLVGYTFFAILALFAAIHQGLLGRPEMQIAGNGSTSLMLRWFQDRASQILPQPWTISIPLFYYRLAMLAWALWVALALLKWLKWGWQSFSTQVLWRPLGILKKKTPAPK